jgi:hypothetical protein
MDRSHSPLRQADRDGRRTHGVILEADHAEVEAADPLMVQAFHRAEQWSGSPASGSIQHGVVRRLQRIHGNAYVQRILAEGQAASSPRASPVIARWPAWLTNLFSSKATAKVPPADPALLAAFAADFPDSADMIRKSAEALKLIKEAEAAGCKYGGFSEDGPGKATLGAWAYTVGDTVYVPKSHRGTKVTAMGDFLFELNNAIRAPQFAKIHTEAAKGSKGSLTSKTYAYQKVEQEVEGMLRLGQVWFDVKKQAKGKEWDKYDGEFYLGEYQAFKKGKKSKDQIIKDVLTRVYPEGAYAGKTVETFYMDQFTEVSGGK